MRLYQTNKKTVCILTSNLTVIRFGDLVPHGIENESRFNPSSFTRPPPLFSICPSSCPRLSGGLETAPKCGGDGAIQGQIALWTW